jgi:adenosylcobinamide-GDP ribazoletransferase
MLRREAAAWQAALMFFTRWPVRSNAAWDPRSLEHAVAWFPLVGTVVGVVAALVWWLAVVTLGLPPLIGSGLSLAATVLFTGAFHEDGWSDMCDGFGGAHTKERTLEIMKDSRVGAFGAVGLVLMLGLKWIAVASLPLGLVMVALVTLHMASRGAACLLMLGLRYAAEEGKAKPLATNPGQGRLSWAIFTGFAPLILLPGGPMVALALVGATLCMRAIIKKRLDGYTGDCLGATQQLAELAGYLALLAWLS